MSVLVIADHDDQHLKESTDAVVSAARELSETIDLLVAGHGCRAAAEQAACLEGTARVLMADSPHYAHQLAEAVAPLVVEMAGGYRYILAPAGTTGKNLMPRVAALLNVGQVSDIIAIKSGDVFVRPIYAGNALATVRALDAVKVITVRTTAFENAPRLERQAEIVLLEKTVEQDLSRFVDEHLSGGDRPELGSARIVIAGGRGMQSRENFKLLESIADKLGAAIGASRAAVDAGFISNDFQVGQTGKVVAPDLYIAVGLSGAIQHLAGMMESKVVVAINNDPDAPIFQVADYGLVGDLFEILPELERLL